MTKKADSSITVWDVNAIAPDFFLEPGEYKARAEWPRLVQAYVEAMADLDRAVLVNVDPDTERLVLSSIPMRLGDLYK